MLLSYELYSYLDTYSCLFSVNVFCAIVQHQVLIETDDVSNQPVCRRLVLEFKDEDKKDAVVEVHKKLVQQLKPHQAEGQLLALLRLCIG